MKDWQQQAEELLRAVAPQDLDGKPVYVVDEPEAVDADRRLSTGPVYAYTSPFTDLKLMPYLKRCGRWAGRGFCTVVDAEKHRSRQNLLGTVLHEFAHHLTRPGSGLEGLSEADIEWASQKALEFQSANWVRDLWSHRRKNDLPPWDGHEDDFVRACSHLAHRAGRLIESVRPDNLCFGEAYYRSPMFNERAWMAALADELDAAGSIGEILATDPPERFAKTYAMATDWFGSTD